MINVSMELREKQGEIARMPIKGFAFKKNVEFSSISPWLNFQIVGPFKNHPERAVFARNTNVRFFPFYNQIFF